MFFFSVFVSLECIEEYFKKIFDLVTFSPQKWALKFPPATPNKDDQELLSPGPEQAVTSLQELSTLHASLFQCFIVFPYKLDCFSDYLRQKMIDFVWKNSETRKWRVDGSWSDVMVCSRPWLGNSRPFSLGVADAGTLKHDFVAKIWRNRNCFFRILF